MKVNYDSHYDDKYWTFSKEYRTPDGQVHKYNNPGLDWDGWNEIHRNVTDLIPGQDVLDIGCGGGGFSARFLREGRNTFGIDVSQYAIDNCVPDMQGRIVYGDITSKLSPFLMLKDREMPSTFDVVLATDLMEHFYEEDLERAFSWMSAVCRKFMFLCIATVSSKQSEFVLRKGEEVPLKHEVTAISGHVNVRTSFYWLKFFQKNNWKVRYDLMWLYLARREKIDWWLKMPQWGPENVIILEKTCI